MLGFIKVFKDVGYSVHFVGDKKIEINIIEGELIIENEITDEYYHIPILNYEDGLKKATDLLKKNGITELTFKEVMIKQDEIIVYESIENITNEDRGILNNFLKNKKGFEHFIEDINNIQTYRGFVKFFRGKYLFTNHKYFRSLLLK